MPGALRFRTALWVLGISLMARGSAAQTFHDTLDHHSPTDPVHHPIDRPIPHHDGSGDPILDHHFAHLDPQDTHHHATTLFHDPDPHHDHQFQHHHSPGGIHHEDHHHSDGMHHHHIGHAGDLDLNGHIGLGDLAALTQTLGEPGDWDRGDFDGSGFIDRSDVAMLAHSFGETYQQNHTTSVVPEPSTIGLVAAALGTLALAACKRKCGMADVV